MHSRQIASLSMVTRCLNLCCKQTLSSGEDGPRFKLWHKGILHSSIHTQKKKKKKHLKMTSLLKGVQHSAKQEQGRSKIRREYVESCGVC